ncbi:efflux RND transporter periplasmic adaptor subunit [Sphingosinicella sp. LHD-64]|uniref:efflux RND transporter periplasmic adaptor subunit n=1 Tax=Sphingosinicella sp. LHD-64 TaxID=3072139 RepID=UPI00280E9963|nr:efflux RND transporter periplasmic adaptor subunit [Sphingosinicella sp. LHD-64]MDQ8757616.1 efflux RND transporter periplasmic adaptor subunit [Sphingosinicella sp. LHD-64]
MFRSIAALCAALLVAGCGDPAPAPENESAESHAEGAIALNADQIAAAGITLTQPTTAGAGAAIEAPALLESDPDATRIVAAPLEGRIVGLTRNLGDPVRRGETLAVIESRAAAALQAEVERTRTRANLARATLARDQALSDRGFRTRRELEISQAAAEEAETALRLARQQVGASGVRGGSLNRIVVTSPISGRVIARSAVLGQVFAADAVETELFRVANLDRLSVTLSLPPADAARVRPGAMVEIAAPGRRQAARVRFVSPVLDGETRLVRVIADLDNRAGQWRAGEPVQARVRITGEAAPGRGLMIPADAVQTVENRPAVFVRTREGFRVAPVRLGRRDGPLVAVMEGLTGTETIAVRGSFTLKAELGKGEADHGGH